ncbi:MAG: HD domain-containing phosphohydrolase [Chloroflexota bacterium]
MRDGELLGLLGIRSDRSAYFEANLVAWIQAYLDDSLSGLVQEKNRLEAIETAHEINRLLHSTRRFRDALLETLELLNGVTGADASTVLRYNPASRRLDLLAARGLGAYAQSKIYLYPDDGLAGQAAESLQAVWIEDLRHSQQPIWHVRFLSDEGFRGYLALPLVCNDTLQGVVEMLWRDERPVDPRMLDGFSQSAEIISYSLERTSILEDLQRRNDELSSTCNATIEGLSRALELRDLETEGHTRRVSELTLRLAVKMGVPPEQHEILQQGALLHDIGKLGIPDAILLKPGSLTAQEWKVMQQHPLYAYSILAPIVSLRESLDIPLYHHERWDGSGYPYGLAGDQIPLSAQLFAVVDVYDALTSDRPYRAAWPRSQAIAYLREQAGIQFSPLVVKHFLELLEDLK